MRQNEESRRRKRDVPPIGRSLRPPIRPADANECTQWSFTVYNNESQYRDWRPPRLNNDESMALNNKQVRRTDQQLSRKFKYFLRYFDVAFTKKLNCWIHCFRFTRIIIFISGKKKN